MAGDDDWPDMGKELRRVLADGLDVGGTIDETEVLTHVGSVSLEIVIEASDLRGDDQAEAYIVLCDLLATRLREGCAQAFGCLLFSTEPDAGSLVTGLAGMRPESSVYTPVLPLARAQARALAEANVAIYDLLDDATALIGVAADQDPVTTATAETLLEELDELIDRRT
jgi:hypothetical protein